MFFGVLPAHRETGTTRASFPGFHVPWSAFLCQGLCVSIHETSLRAGSRRSRDLRRRCPTRGTVSSACSDQDRSHVPCQEKGTGYSTEDVFIVECQVFPPELCEMRTKQVKRSRRRQVRARGKCIPCVNLTNGSTFKTLTVSGEAVKPPGASVGCLTSAALNYVKQEVVVEDSYLFLGLNETFHTLQM